MELLASGPEVLPQVPPRDPGAASTAGRESDVSAEVAGDAHGKLPQHGSKSHSNKAIQVLLQSCSLTKHQNLRSKCVGLLRTLRGGGEGGRGEGKLDFRKPFAGTSSSLRCVAYLPTAMAAVPTPWCPGVTFWRSGHPKPVLDCFQGSCPSLLPT